MKYNSEIHHRRSIRMQGYDYHQAGAYFVTLCTQNHDCLLGNIIAGEMQLNGAGLMIRRWYTELSNKFPDIECDEFICMPNHAHFIAINRVVQWFKTMTTNEYIRGVKQNRWPSFSGKLWQRNYWEHIVRSETELGRIREYIRNNPAQWEFDKLFVPVDLYIRPEMGTREQGQTHRSAPTRIHKPSATHGYGVSDSDKEPWMA